MSRYMQFGAAADPLQRPQAAALARAKRPTSSNALQNGLLAIAPRPGAGLLGRCRHPSADALGWQLEHIEAIYEGKNMANAQHIQRRTAHIAANPAPARFIIGRDRRGTWIVQDRQGLVGGLFANEERRAAFSQRKNATITPPISAAPLRVGARPRRLRNAVLKPALSRSNSKHPSTASRTRPTLL